MPKLKLLFASLIAGAVILTGCQTSSVQTAAAGSGARYWELNQQKLSSLKAVKESGKIALKSAQGSGSLNFLLDYTPQKTRLSLTDVFGREVATFTDDGTGEVRLRADGITYTDTSVSALFAKHFGLNLPDVDLIDLMLGRAQEEAVFDEEGKLLGMRLFPYLIEYISFTSANNVALPEQIGITGPNLQIVIKTGEVLQVE